MENKIELIVEDVDIDSRIDRYLSDNEYINSLNETLSRSYIQKLIKDEYILVNNKKVKSSYIIKEGDKVTLTIPEPIALDIIPENIPLDIVYEDDDIIIINKAKGMVVHPAPGHMQGTIVNALLYHCEGRLSGINGVLRPGIVHRIDRDTTGIVVCCKNDKAHLSISNQLKEHSITRVYKAIVHNRINSTDGTVNKPIGRNPSDRKKMAIVANGRNAITHYKVINNLDGNYSYIECRLETGRTHQIRVHMASINHPLYGDEVYGIKSKNERKTNGQVLHAAILGFVHPTTGNYIEFEAPLPDYFEKLLKIL